MLSLIYLLYLLCTYIQILTTTIRFWAPPANQPIPYVALPFGVLFECLDIDNVIFAWYALTLERKILLISSQCSLLTICSEILCSLLFPMQWSHLYVPVLPRFLSPMLGELNYLLLELFLVLIYLLLTIIWFLLLSFL